MATFTPTPARRTRRYSAGDVPQTIKHGQTMDSSFFQSIISAYTNTVHRPHILIFIVIVAYVFIAEWADTDGPLEAVKTLSDSVASNTTYPAWEQKAANVLSGIFSFLIYNKFRFITLTFAFMPYMFYPSYNSLFVCIGHGFLIFLMRNWQLLDFILLSQIHFLFASVRNPAYKLIILIAGLFFFFIGLEIGSSPIKQRKLVETIKATTSTKKSSNTSNP